MAGVNNAAGIKPLVVPFKTFCQMIGCKGTKGREILPHVDARKLGNSLVITVESIEAYVAALPNAKGAPAPAAAMRARAERRQERPAA